MNDVVMYAPWVPRFGMRGWFTHLAGAWGNPNSPGHSWPQATLEAVCKRGTPLPVRYDSCASSMKKYQWGPA